MIVGRVGPLLDFIKISVELLGHSHELQMVYVPFQH